MVFNGLHEGHYGAILADPPWRFAVWSQETGSSRSASRHYETIPIEEIYALPVEKLAAKDCVLFLWIIWPMLEHGLRAIDEWGFKYKTCAFAWMKANARQMEMWNDATPDMLTGYWTRANSEVCLLATKGRPKRINADVRQGIIEPRREHSRKPEQVYDRIERLVSGPYVELFARGAQRPGWTMWGDQLGIFTGTKSHLSLVSPSGGSVALPKRQT